MKNWNTSRSRLTARLILLLLCTFCFGACSCGQGCLSIKQTYIDTAYPIPSGPQTPRRWGLNISSVLTPSLLVGYEQPAQVGTCLAKLNQRPNKLRKRLLRFGKCLNGQPVSQKIWQGCLTKHFPWLQINAGTCKATFPCALSPADQVNLTLSLASTGALLYAYITYTFGRPRIEPSLVPTFATGIKEAINNASQTLQLDPSANHPKALNRSNLPALALSGGGPNGAFTAGYLHAMLSLRELALNAADVPAKIKESIQQKERFGTAVGTSVGALIAPVIDLYFTKTPKKPSPAALTGLRSCLGKDYSPKDPSAFQKCALRRLVENFNVNEWDYLCAAKGNALAPFVGKQKYLVAFDPLQATLLVPFMKAFGQDIVNNQFHRIAMAIELDQKLLVSLDERFCRKDPAKQQDCLVSAIMASISEPAQTPAVTKVYTGLTNTGEKGLWYDGGIRSGLPSSRAASATYKRVLAISTDRLLNIPNTSDNAFAILITSATSAISQNGQWELSFAQVSHQAKQNQRRWLRGCFGQKQSSSQPTNSPDAAFPSIAGGVMPVYVPETIKPERLYASGYTFDPFVMKGLFLWGQKTFLRRRHFVYKWLGWRYLSALERSCKQKGKARSGCSKVYAKAVRDYARDVNKTLNKTYIQPNYDLAFWQKRAKERRKLVGKYLKVCKR